MSALLMFVRLLLTYLASLAQDNIVLKFVSESIPKSMYTIRKIIIYSKVLLNMLYVHGVIDCIIYQTVSH